MERIIKKLLICVLFCLGLPLTAQIVNIETLRFMLDSNGWVGQIQASLNYKEDKFTNFSSSTGLHLAYKHNKHNFLTISSFGYMKVDENELANNLFGHLRYNYDLSSTFIIEAFVQSKYDEFINIRMRNLAGGGLRIKLAHTKKLRFYSGFTGMYEHEELTDNIKNEGARMSDYISFVYSIDPFTFSYTTYYQPRFDEFDNFRISSDSNVQLKVFKKLSFFASFNLEYDSQRPEEIPSSVSNFKSGVNYTF